MDDLKGAWVKVRTSPGLFSSEFTVKIKEANGNSISLLADKNIVCNQGTHEYLKVSVVKNNTPMNNKTVLLPTEAFETSSRWVVVHSDMVINDFK